MKPISTSTFTFSRLIREGFLYVDKTALIYELIRLPFGQYFLARPRRFGKSLLLSTLKSIFQGERDLFRGLAIDRCDYSWTSYPVIHIDLGDRQAKSAAQLEECLTSAVDEQARWYNIPLREKASAHRFRELILGLSKQNPVVILIDEYDKPILGNVENLEVAKEIQRVLKGFYSVIKTTEGCQRFAFLTGVSKFSKVSVFSDLNNLTDLTMDPRTATLLGYTQEEVEQYFADRIDRLATTMGISREGVLQKIQEWYNGYRFCEEAPRVYNPVSLMLCLESGKFRNYWFETGTPTFLIELLKKGGYDIAALEHLRVSEVGFSAYEIEHLAAEPLLFQTGYLTIQDYDPESMLYTLGYPNREVFQSFTQHLAGAFTAVHKEQAAGEAYKLVEALRQKDLESFFHILKVFFAGIEYDLHLQHEKYYQTVFYLVLRLMGLFVRTEVKTHRGRVDAVVETADQIYLFEFKLGDTAEAALAQIRERGYADPWRGRGKPLTLVGVSFDPTEKNIGRWIVADEHPSP